uniref:Uncharacterized protein n=1 Tax=Arundo donax TaxID=35708 RepID=A0A0A9B1F7_ARUDO
MVVQIRSSCRGVFCWI